VLRTVKAEVTRSSETESIVLMAFFLIPRCCIFVGWAGAFDSILQAAFGDLGLCGQSLVISRTSS